MIVDKIISHELWRRANLSLDRVLSLAETKKMTTSPQIPQQALVRMVSVPAKDF